MVTADELIEELKSAGWRVSERYLGDGEWGAFASRMLPSGNVSFCETFGDSVQVAVEKLYRDCQRLEAAIK